MAATARKSNPDLWKKIKARVTRGAKGGDPGTWSARKAQLATAAYKKAGGGYRAEKSADNHLTQWSKEHDGSTSGTGARRFARTTKKRRAASGGAAGR